MKKVFILFIVLLWNLNSFSQTVIAKQSFEVSGDTWLPLNFSTPPCTVGNDVWDYTTSFPSFIDPSEGVQFWGIRDLNGSCGGNGFETIIFPNVNISSFTNVTFSFDYNAINFDNGEDLKYELFFNGVSQGEIIVVDGVGGGSDNTNGWRTETVSIPNGINSLSVVLFARCSAGNERAGFDNVQLIEGSTSSLVNDNCPNAVILTVGTDNTQNVVTGTNEASTSSGELPNPNCGNYLGNDVWYTAQVPASGTITIETQSVAGSSLDPAIEIYSGSCGSLTRLACNDDISYPTNLNPQIELTSIPNTTIYIRVWAWNNNSIGEFDIVAYSPSIPNDDCVNATTLTVGTTNTQNIVTSTNVGATDSGVSLPNNCDQYLGGDVWFTAQIPASGILNIETSNAGGITDTGLAVYTGSCSGGLTQIDCDADSGPGFFSVINLTGLPNTTVYIRVWEYQNNNFGEFNIVAYSPECPFITTWNGSSWNNGTPNSFTSAIINGNYDSAINGNFDSCNCTINSGATINVRANSYILIENDLTVNGTLEVRHEGSLVMIENDGVINSSGTINIHKTSTSFNQFDYIYWSSPTSNETIGSALASSQADKIYRWDNLNGWFDVAASIVMEQGKGYIAQGSITGTFPQNQSVIFDGIANTGIIETPVGKSSNPGLTNLDWNLIGNPYPSALNATLFLDSPLNTPIVNGTIYLWTHNTEISDTNPGIERYNYTKNDYASFTSGTGGVAAVSGGEIPSGFIASGQGFFIQAISGGNATFDNSMRVTNNNNQFFKSSNDNKIEKDRIWLNLFNDRGAFSQLLVGFIDGATDGLDRSYDGPKFGSGNFVSFYSIVENKNLAVQGKSPIKGEENIKLGLSSYIETSDTLKIGIDKIEGALREYNIYLKDKNLNIIHDLNIKEYVFIPETNGIFNDRFELIFTKSQVLSVDENIAASENLILINKEDNIEVKTTKGTSITHFKAYDLLGKTIFNLKPNKSNFTVNTNNLAKGTVLFINVTLENSIIVKKKFLIH